MSWRYSLSMVLMASTSACCWWSNGANPGVSNSNSKGLGLMRGRVIRFPENGLRVPQIGWNQIEELQSHPLLEGLNEGTYFYFVHSYYCEPLENQVVVGETDYGVNYASVVARENICGVQFHPEKSQESGLRLLRNFARLN